MYRNVNRGVDVEVVDAPYDGGRHPQILINGAPIFGPEDWFDDKERCQRLRLLCDYIRGMQK